MKSFKDFISEDAGEKFRAMSDEQFADWKKANPGAASKADRLRTSSGEGYADWKKANPNAASKEDNLRRPSGNKITMQDKDELKKSPKPSQVNKNSSALVKSPQSNAADKGSALVKKRQSAMGKWSQSLQNKNKKPKGKQVDLSGVTDKLKKGVGSATDKTKSVFNKIVDVAKSTNTGGATGVEHGSQLSGLQQRTKGLSN